MGSGADVKLVFRRCKHCGAEYIHPMNVVIGQCGGCGGMNSLYDDMGTAKGKQDVKVLADNHWQYIESVLKQHGESEDVTAKCGHHYRAAFEHGFKHAKESQ